MAQKRHPRTAGAAPPAAGPPRAPPAVQPRQTCGSGATLRSGCGLRHVLAHRRDLWQLSAGERTGLLSKFSVSRYPAPAMVRPWRSARGRCHDGKAGRTRPGGTRRAATQPADEAAWRLHRTTGRPGQPPAANRDGRLPRVRLPWARPEDGCGAMRERFPDPDIRPGSGFPTRGDGARLRPNGRVPGGDAFLICSKGRRVSKITRLPATPAQPSGIARLRGRNRARTAA